MGLDWKTTTLHVHHAFLSILAVFILRTHYLTGRTWVNVLLFIWLCVSSIKTGIRRIMRLDELSFEMRLEGRTRKGSSSRRTMRLVPVFILETHNPDELQNVCPSSSRRIRTAIYLAVVALLHRESVSFHILSRTGTQDNNFLFLFLNFDTVLYNSTHKTFASIWRIKRAGICAIKFEAAPIHFLSDVVVAVTSLLLKFPFVINLVTVTI